MLEIAVNDLEVPLVIVMGHTECLAIKQVIDGRASAGGSLRHEVHRAVAEARQKGGDNLFERAVEENALQTARLLREESFAVRQAIADRRVKLVCSVYDVHSGEVRMLNDRM